jgi:hypothetical protein
MMGALSFFSFGFVSFDCMFTESNPMTSVYIWSCLPVVVGLMLVCAHLGALVLARDAAPDASTLAYRLLVMGYMLLPVVSLKQLQALDCVEVAQKRYLRIDTSVDCDSNEYQLFKIVDGAFIAVYLATPLLWFYLLFVNRDRLNPAHTAGLDTAHSIFVRDMDSGLSPLRFLFSVYKPKFFFAECIEMYR